MSKIKIGDIVRFVDGRHDGQEFEVVWKQRTWSRIRDENEIDYMLEVGPLIVTAWNGEIEKVKDGDGK